MPFNIRFKSNCLQSIKLQKLLHGKHINSHFDSIRIHKT